LGGPLVTSSVEEVKSFSYSDVDDGKIRDMREVLFEVCGFVKILLTNLSGNRDGSGIFVVPVGSIMKETNVAGSDMDFSVKIETNGGFGRCVWIFRNRDPPIFHIKGCTFEFKSYRYERKKSMHVLTMKLDYKQGLIQFTCDVDVVDQPGFSSLYNTFFVRYYTGQFIGVGDVMKSIKRRASMQNINDSHTGTLVGFGWELLTIIALVQLGKLPVIDPACFNVSLDMFNVTSSTDNIHDVDYHIAILGQDDQMNSIMHPQFSELEVLCRISEILTAREDGRQLVIKYRDADIQPRLPDAALIIVDPCVPPDSLGNNVARAVQKPGLERIRLGLKIIIKELAKPRR
jgi:hypothetical protein